MNKIYETIIGLEVHLEIKTKSKFFCSCLNQEALKPNLNICPICLGHPGVLPVINKEAVKKALLLGIGLGGEIEEICYFERKNYFYPDLPKGYQISQYQKPLIRGGALETKEGKIFLERIHLEEDTAKIYHQEKESLLDFNRAGIPLLEVVTKPEIKSPRQARIFLEELQRVVRFLEISDANMEKGQMRCDANISIRPKGDKRYYPKVEIKNLNSFKSVEKALLYEEKRQKDLWERGEINFTQDTRRWNEKESVTFSQRTKEEEKDYRYFPEPDLPFLVKQEFLKQGIDINALRLNLPELPLVRYQRFIQEYGFDSSQAELLANDKKLADYTEKVVLNLKKWLLSQEEIEGSVEDVWEKSKRKISKLLSNWLINNLLVLQRKSQTTEFRIKSEYLSEFICFVCERRFPLNLSQEIFQKMFKTGKSVDEIICEYDFKASKIETEELNVIIKEIINNNQEIVNKYRSGKSNVVQYLIGQAMKKTKGKIEAEKLKAIFKKELKELDI